ncbi:MAG: ACP S-malonyltransferase [candidate division Zixibacteria bacterium]|nr:ACP S-malonyltransferase [candidate division Zixibacteria bacterium]
MSKTALLFPGQASQYVGMGQDLFESSTGVRELYELASKEIGADIARLSFEGPVEELKKTRFTQPAILLHSLAVFSVLGDDLPAFDYACGHSLGEYTALAATGALSFEDAIKAVVKRASLMEAACNKTPGTMAAILGLNESQLESICREASSKGIVVPANFNSRVQIVLSGSIDAVHEAVELARKAGAKRAIIIEVGGAFHSPLMEPAKVALEEFLRNVDIGIPSKPVIANVTAEPVSDSNDIRQWLGAQLTAPVKWSQTMTYLTEKGVTKIMELGPGKVLSGLAKRDMRPEKSITLDTLADIETFKATTV